ncbi:putative siderophore biosynthesis protein SbnA [Rubripirellula lacrimiformis]|uniref:N-(2-amino-2-carboxyethyl)-L-glutamate synthase n=1 Tax=Rubripirellula lacrimiformis TaxID=1930273 RepID=A0A517N4F9_9BACT|nr:2,3-diaminopropionate biosynthesis protein SbnA [Rubripirellula lacrimiformis]QDT02021.1 putative siderophore biosynthesis protein SbnA [Rubripirellula lacrimiformis]
MMQPSLIATGGVLDSIGHTPLIQLDRFLRNESVELLVKLESANPGGSAKDRPAKQMLESALERGDVHGGSTIIESSSGNMGIGLAQACRYHGLKFVCVVDPRAQRQNLAIIEALGGTIDLVEQPLHGDFLAARIARVRHLLDQTPHSYWPNQYANPNNPLAHFEGTIREIDEALHGEWDVLFVATSSTGTAQGCRDYLRSRGRNVQVVAVDSVGSVLFGGTSGPRMIPGLGAGKEPRLAVGQSFDHVMRVTDLDCVVGCRRAAHREALLVGGSAGGVLISVDRMANDLSGKRCVAILHDSGTRYLETVFNDRWVENSLDCNPATLAQLVDGSPMVLETEVSV